MNCWQVRFSLCWYLACNTYIKYFIIISIMLYTYKTELYTYTHKEFYCVNCHNTRNLYHIRVIDGKNNSSTYVCVYIDFFLHFQAEVKLEYLLNLSILISKGKEINWDCLSNGEWTGKSSLLKRVKFTFSMHCSIWGNSCMVPVRVSSFDQGFNHRRC